MVTPHMGGSMELLSEYPVPEHARDVKAEAREFAEEHIEPVAADYYESGEYPWEVLEAGMEAGLVGQDLSEDVGGKGYDLEQVLAIAEEMYRADAGIALTLQLASFGAEIVEDHGSEAQAEEYLRPVAENEQITGLAVSEPDTGSDLAGMTTSAEKDGDEWVINGEKYWIGNGVEADWVTLYAKTGDDPNAWDFVHDREAFGRTVDEFQAVQHKLADMQLQFQSARSLTWDAAHHVANQEDAGYWAALAKTAGTEAATECSQKSMQLHGGRSVLLENRISRVFRDARIPVIYEGANDIQRNLIYRQTPQ